MSVTSGRHRSGWSSVASEQLHGLVADGVRKWGDVVVPSGQTVHLFDLLLQMGLCCTTGTLSFDPLLHHYSTVENAK